MEHPGQVDHSSTVPWPPAADGGYDDPAHPAGRRAIYRWARKHRRVPDADRRRPDDREDRTGLRGTRPKACVRRHPPGPTHHIINDPGHVDHVGGVDLFKEPGTTYSAQANNRRRQATKSDRGPGDEHGRTGRHAGTEADADPPRTRGLDGQSEPMPDIVFEDRLARRRRPAHRATRWWARPPTAASCGRQTASPRLQPVGPAVPALPERGHHPRRTHRFVEPSRPRTALVRVSCAPTMLVTGRYEPIVGDEPIEASLEASRRRRRPTCTRTATSEGSNAGNDVEHLDA